MINYGDTQETRERKLREADEILARHDAADKAAADAIDPSLTRRKIRETPDEFLRRIGYKS